MIEKGKCRRREEKRIYDCHIRLDFFPYFHLFRVRSSRFVDEIIILIAIFKVFLMIYDNFILCKWVRLMSSNVQISFFLHTYFCSLWGKNLNFIRGLRKVTEKKINESQAIATAEYLLFLFLFYFCICSDSPRRPSSQCHTHIQSCWCFSTLSL